MQDFSGQDLRGVDFRDAPLHRTNFKNARLRDTDFRGADLREADFTDATGLLPGNLAGANLAGAELPANIGDFHDLSALEAASDNAKTLFITMLGACMYSWLTIATTTDSALLINNVSSPLPLISTLIPIDTFYYFTPPVLLCLQVYFLFNLQNVWNLLSRLPAIFPDGTSLEQKSSPWLLTDLVSFYFRHLRLKLRPVSYLQRFLSVFLAWYFVPVTLLGFWFRYLPVRDFVGTIWQTFIIALSLLFSTSLQSLGYSTLSMETGLPGNAQIRAARRRGHLFRISLVAVTAGVLILVAAGVIYGKWRPDSEFLTKPPWKVPLSSSVAWLSARLGISGFLKLNLAHLDLSTKPGSWSGKDSEIDSVIGANLSGRDISFANCDNCFAAKARFVGANLAGAQFSYSDLRKSDFSRANGREASFTHARLTETSFGASKMVGARFYGAILDGSVFTSDFLRTRLEEYSKSYQLRNFSSANFSGTDFTYATMKNCDCRSTIFTKSRFLVAQLENVDFTGADLTTAYFTAASISNCRFDLTQLSGSSFDGATLTSVCFDGAELGDPNSKLVAVFTNATLRGVDFSQAKHLTSAVFTGAHFDRTTIWQEGFNPGAAGATQDDINK